MWWWRRFFKRWGFSSGTQNLQKPGFWPWYVSGTTYIIIGLFEKKFEHFVWSAKYPLGRFTQWSKSRLRVTYRTSTKRLLRPYPTTYIYYYSQRPLIELDRIMTVELLAFWLGGLSNIIQGWVTLLSQKSSCTVFYRRHLLINLMHFYFEIRLDMWNLLNWIMSYYEITTVIINITDLNIEIWGKTS